MAVNRWEGVESDGFLCRVSDLWKNTQRLPLWEGVGGGVVLCFFLWFGLVVLGGKSENERERNEREGERRRENEREKVGRNNKSGRRGESG